MVSLKNLQIFSEAEIIITNLMPFDISKLIVSRFNREGYHSSSFYLTYFSEAMESINNGSTLEPTYRNSSKPPFDSLVTHELLKRGTLTPTGATHPKPHLLMPYNTPRKSLYA